MDAHLQVPRKYKPAIRIAREILNSTAFVNDWERNFLNTVVSQKHVSSKQARIINRIARQTRIAITEPAPEAQPPINTYARFKALEDRAIDMTPADQQKFRDQIRIYRQSGKDFLNAKIIATLHQKYLTGRRKQTP